MFENTSRLTRL